VDDNGFEAEVPGDELEAVRLALAELGEQPLPPAVAIRLDARLAAELASSPLSARRARRRHVRLGASLSAAAAVAAIAVFALSWGGGGRAPAPNAAGALQSSVASAAADSAAKTAAGATKALPLQAKRCRPASRTAGDRPRAGCPGARGGHARAV
jgi:hypothetical protein